MQDTSETSSNQGFMRVPIGRTTYLVELGPDGKPLNAESQKLIDLATKLLPHYDLPKMTPSEEHDALRNWRKSQKIEV